MCTRRESTLALLVGNLVLSLACVGCGPASSSSTSNTATSGTTKSNTATSNTGSLASEPTTPVVETVPESLESLKQRVVDAFDAKDFDRAIVSLQAVLIRDPADVDSLYSLAELYAAKRQWGLAIETADEVVTRTFETDRNNVAIAALGKSAAWCVDASRFDEAIDRLRKVLSIVPDSGRAHRELASIYNRQGRRHEAAQHIRVLCKLGDIRRDELHALMVLSDAVEVEVSGGSTSDESDQLQSSIGAGGLARKLFTEERYAEAVEVLRPTAESHELPPALLALYGRCLAESQSDDLFAVWTSEADASITEFAEYWAAIGAWLVNQRRFDEAVRALSEAILRDPTDARSYRRMDQALTALRIMPMAKRWDDRHQLLRTVTLASNQIGSSPDAAGHAKSFEQVIEGLKQLGRPLEALLWQVMSEQESLRAVSQEGQSGGPDSGAFAVRLAELNQQRREIVQSGRSFPDEATRLCGVDRLAYPLADVAALARLAPKVSLQAKVTRLVPARFKDVAREVGLDQEYHVASKPHRVGFSIYQVIGGGVAALDYDLDGHVDLYFAQGAADAPEFVSEQTNRLYRQVDGRTLDTTIVSGTDEYRYSTGVTAGDWNQDGFVDLAVGNLGTNVLFLNNGDGTFRRQSTGEPNDPSNVTSSLAIADLDGDHLPDLFEQTYVHDPDFTRVPEKDEQGRPAILSPFLFEPGMDRVYFNDGRGGWTRQDVSELPEQRGAGLGVVVGPIDGEIGNDVYVGNDMNPNQLWKVSRSREFEDLAPLANVALGHDGTRTASMGIAAGDFDRTGTLDLHITNFESSPVRFYVNRDHSFQDRAIAFGLAQPSTPVVGFGTQAIDYDNDRFEDLVVTNGHVEDTGIESSPFAQPPQLFANLGNRFELVDVQDSSGYFDDVHVGRALSRLDFNRDGLVDFVVTHLGSAPALLLNETVTDHHWIAIQLVGVECERDAIGAVVKLTAEGAEQRSFQLAGDGYLCRNEGVIHFGLAGVSKVERLEILWPDGTTQTHTDLAVDQRLLVIQHDPAPHTLFSNLASTAD